MLCNSNVFHTNQSIQYNRYFRSHENHRIIEVFRQPVSVIYFYINSIQFQSGPTLPHSPPLESSKDQILKHTLLPRFVRPTLPNPHTFHFLFYIFLFCLWYNHTLDTYLTYTALRFQYIYLLCFVQFNQYVFDKSPRLDLILFCEWIIFMKES